METGRYECIFRKMRGHTYYTSGRHSDEAVVRNTRSTNKTSKTNTREERINGTQR